MKATRVVELLSALGANRISNLGLRIKSTCPLAPWRHSKGNDKHPSFMVFVSEDDESYGKCLGASCNFKGTLTQLVWAIAKHSGNRMDKHISFIHSHDQVDLDKKLDRISNNLGMFSMDRPSRDVIHHSINGPDYSDPIEFADKIPGLEGHEHRVKEMQDLLNEESLSYLRSKKRNVSDGSIETWRLGWHPGARRISVPQYDRKGRLVNIAGRHVPGEFDDQEYSPPPWMHAKNFKKEYYLFGEDKFVDYSGIGTMVLVEGMFDAIFLHDQGIPNVAAMLGAHLSKTQYAKITRWFNKLVIVPDGDQPGMDAVDRIVELMGRKIETKVFPTPTGKDPDELTAEEVKNLKDNFIS